MQPPPIGYASGDGDTGNPSPASGPLCDAAFTTERAGESYQSALSRIDGYYNGLDLIRVYYTGLPAARPGKLDTGGRPVNVSFKAKPSEVLAGTDDATLREWFQNAPRDRDTYWTYYHEPEDNIRNGEFTAAQFTQAFQRVSKLADEADNRYDAVLVGKASTMSPDGATVVPARRRSVRSDGCPAHARRPASATRSCLAVRSSRGSGTGTSALSIRNLRPRGLGACSGRFSHPGTPNQAAG